MFLFIFRTTYLCQPFCSFHRKFQHQAYFSSPHLSPLRLSHSFHTASSGHPCALMHCINLGNTRISIVLLVSPLDCAWREQVSFFVLVKPQHLFDTPCLLAAARSMSGRRRRLPVTCQWFYRSLSFGSIIGLVMGRWHCIQHVLFYVLITYIITMLTFIIHLPF